MLAYYRCYMPILIKVGSAHTALLRHAVRRLGLIFTGDCICDSNKINNSISCENESINNFQMCKKVELCKKCNLLTVACIVNARYIPHGMLETNI